MAKKISRREFIKTGAQVGLFAGISGSALSRGYVLQEQDYDLIIKNGTIIDGIKSEKFVADVGIKGEKILAIGHLDTQSSKSFLDASGKIVAPGFIDIHTHTGIGLLINPKAESKIRQGVTTEVSGNCGGSFTPRKKSQRYNWTDFAGFQSELSQKGIALNYATFVGNGTIRRLVIGDELREPASLEMEQMKGMVDEAMQQGVFGLSTGLEYSPSGFAQYPELIELCKVVAKHGGIYATHMRCEDQHVMEALAEAIYIAEEAGLPIQISHLKVAGKINWWKLPKMLDLIERAHERGIPITADRYPYMAYSTGLSILYPQWARNGGNRQFVQRLKDKNSREKMRDDTIAAAIANNSWESMLIVDVRQEKNNWMEGKFLSEIAAQMNQDPYEFACDLLIQEGGSVSIIGFGMNEENTASILKHPLVMVGSDGSALAPYGELSRGIPHPRNYGTFPRFLGHYVREKKLVPLPEAIRKMTSMPADKLGLEDRGRIKTGSYADLVVFDSDTIIDRATYTEPQQYPEGIDYVLVNGKIVIEKGKHTGNLPGRVLTR